MFWGKLLYPSFFCFSQIKSATFSVFSCKIFKKTLDTLFLRGKTILEILIIEFQRVSSFRLKTVRNPQHYTENKGENTMTNCHSCTRFPQGTCASVLHCLQRDPFQKCCHCHRHYRTDAGADHRSACALLPLRQAGRRTTDHFPRCRDEVDLVLFFRDPLKVDASSLNEQNLLRLCDMARRAHCHQHCHCRGAAARSGSGRSGTTARACTRRLWSPCPYWNTAPCAETDFVYRGKQRRRNVLRRCCFVYSCLPSGRNT